VENLARFVPLKGAIKLKLVLEDPLADDNVGLRGRGTRFQVWFFNRALCSSSIAARQLGSARALWKVFSIGERGAVWNATSIRKPVFDRVPMACWLVTRGTTSTPLGKGRGATGVGAARAAGAGAVGASYGRGCHV
jgi:hypothetical protein